MKRKFLNLIAGGVLGLALGFGWWSPTRAQDDPLPSWNATPIEAGHRRIRRPGH